MVMVPVATLHVGSTCAVVGAAGAPTVASVISVTAEIHPAAFCAVSVCAPAIRPGYPPAGYAAYAPPSRLKVSAVVVDVMVMVPVATVHVGSTCAVTGAVGVGGCGNNVVVVTGEIHPAALCAVSVCAPLARPGYPPAGYAAYAPPSRLKVSAVVVDVMVMVPVATVHVGSTCAVTGAVGVGGCGNNVVVVTGEIHPAALCAVSVCAPLARPGYPPAGYAAYAPPSRLKVSPAVVEVMVMVPVASVHVGSTCAVAGAVGVAGCGNNVVVVTGEIHPAALCAVSVCAPLARPGYPPAGYAAYAPPSRLKVSPVVVDVMVMVPVATVHVGSTCAVTGAVGVGGCGNNVVVVTGEIHPAALCAVSVCAPLARPGYPPAGYAAYAPPSRLKVSPVVVDVMVMVPVATVHVG